MAVPFPTLAPPLAQPAPGALALQVVSGLHAGVNVPVQAAGCTVGSSVECEIVLADEGVAPDHLRLRFYGRLAAVDAVGGDVGIDGRPLLARGHGCRVPLPVTLVLGQTRLTVSRQDAGRPALRRMWLYAAGLVSFVLLPIVATQAGMSPFPGDETAEGAPQPTAEGRVDPSILTASMAPAPRARASDEAVAGELRTRIAEAGLEPLSVAREGRRLVVSGEVPQGRLADWTAVQQAFDRAHGARYILTSMVGAAAATKAPHFEFQAVWFGENPYVLDARGERRYPGAALADGWLLKSIESDRILVGRDDGQEFALTL